MNKAGSRLYLIGKTIKILNSHGAYWAKKGEEYTVAGVNYAGDLVINGSPWACTDNSYEVMEKDIHYWMKELDKYIYHREKKDPKREKRLFRRQQKKLKNYEKSV